MKEYSFSLQLTAAECNPQGEMPLGLLVERIIEAATRHANAWGVGYANLIESEQVWVLSRLTLEMTRYPRVNEQYTLTTWIEDYNRHFSRRHIAIAAQGEIVGYARTIWMVIDFNTRASVDISKLGYIAANAKPDKPCPIDEQARFAPFEATEQAEYTFRFTDCDINRHVNTVRYVELLLDQFPLEWHDSNAVRRVEMAFAGECRYGDVATLLFERPKDELQQRIDIAVEGKPKVKSRMFFKPREI